MTKVSLFGEYQILGLIGQGGMGKVYKAFDTNLKRVVALKILISKEISLLQRFTREVRAMAKLNHPNIIKILNTGEIDGTHFFTMEYIEGFPLQNHMKQYSLAVNDIVNILYKVTMAVNHAHSQGIVHRDLKPENIMIRQNGQPVVMDFGLAKQNAQDYQLTKTGEILGSPFYMSPEQAQGNVKNIDARSDIYALGIIMHYMLVGKVPYSSTNFSNLILEIIEKPIEPLHKINPTIAVVLSQICNKATQKNPRDRYQNTLLFAKHLRNFSQNRKVSISSSAQKKKIKIFLVISSLLTIFCLVLFQKVNKASLENTHEQILNINDSFQNGKSLFRQGFYEQSFQELTKSLLTNQNPEQIVEINKYFFLICIETKEYEKANIYHGKLSENSKSAPEIMLGQAKIFYYKKQYTEALNILTLVEDTQDKDLLLQVFLYEALIFYDKQDYKTAFTLFQKAQKVENNNNNKSLIFYYLGICCYWESKPTEAIGYLNEAKQFYFQQPEVYIYLAKCYLQTKNIEAAQKILEDGEKFCNKNGEYLALYGQVYEQKKDYTLAMEKYNAAFDIDIANLEALEGSLRITISQNNIRNPYLLYIFNYFSDLTQKSTATKNIFAYEFSEIEQKYQPYYNTWLYLSRKQFDNLETLMDTLIDNNSEMHEIATNGIISLRYQPQVEDRINKKLSLLEKNSRSYERISKLLSLITNKKVHEKDYLIAYYVAKSYLSPEFIVTSELSNYIGSDSLFATYHNPDKTDIIRYLTAKALVQKFHYEIIEESINSGDPVRSIIGHLLQFEENIKIPFVTLDANTSDFLTAMIARYSKNSQVYTLLKHPAYFVRINASINLLKEEKTPSNIKEMCIDIVEKAMKHSEFKYRMYAHFYFWDTKIGVKQYIDFFILGCLDENIAVQQAAMQSYSKLHNNELFIEELRKSDLFITQMEKIVVSKNLFPIRVLAGLWLEECDSDNEIIAAVVHDDNEPFFLRFIFSAGVDIFSLKGISRVITNVKELTQDKNFLLRAGAYYFSSAINDALLPYLEQEKDFRLKASILMSFRMKSLALFPPRVYSNDDLAIIRRYLKNKHGVVRGAAYAAMVALNTKNINKKAYDTIKKSNDQEILLGASIGYYTLIDKNIISPVQNMNILNDYKTTAEEDYKEYIGRMLSSAKRKEKREIYKEWLTLAIGLFEHDIYYYERACLLELDGEYVKAISDLDRAFAIFPKKLYVLTKAEILISSGKEKEAFALLQNIDTQSSSLYEFTKLIELHIKLKKYAIGYELLQKFNLLFFSSKREHKIYIHSILVEIYKEMGNKNALERHLEYYHNLVKK